MKILSSSITATVVTIKDLTTGATTIYLSAINAALALNYSNYTIMKSFALKGNKTKIYKGRYIISNKLCLKYGHII